MDKPRLFQIEFEPTSATFRAGQVVRGKVYLVTEGYIHNVTGIKVSAHGGAKVHWTEDVTVRDEEKNGFKTVQKTYSNSEAYFESHQYVFGDGRQVSLVPGTFSYPFTFLIQKNSPASFEHSLGHVRYCVRSKIIRSHNLKVFKCSAQFTVAERLDLNRDPGLMEPRSVSGHKTFGLFCCETGPLSAMVHLSKTGFVPGEVMKICAEIDNKSSRHLDGSSAKIIQRLSFVAETKVSTRLRILAETWQGEILPGGEDQWTDVGPYSASVKS